ncbi:MAG: response regulator transcription factor [Treponema sp.]|jgi:DNA-binding response OmpR family regulator|nr:response regulator transcription factor [Treponema sp.]
MDGAILAIDDETKILETVKAYLERAGYRVFCAVNGVEAQRILTHNSVSMVLLDLMLPDVTGEEICKRIRNGFYDKTARDVPVIMITAKTDEASIVHGLNIGADDYITKPFSPRELVARVGSIMRRIRPRENSLLTVGDVVIDREKRMVKRDGAMAPLTSNEYRIFELLASRPEKIFTREEIINKTKDDFDGFDRAIDLHIKNIRKKLGDDPKAPRYIETVYGMGYRIKQGI